MEKEGLYFKRQTALHILTNKRRWNHIFFFFFLLLTSLAFAQQPQVSAGIDSTNIKIGEQIRYSIEVETDSTDLVVFPEGNTFSPLEVVESMKTDTSRSQDRFRLLKEYSLTQFDSGSYTIPQQRVIINDREFLTDSMLVQVANVVVDTTKQKMYPIKPSVEAPSTFEIPNWVWWVLLGIAVIIGLLFLFRKKRKEAREKELPPYEQAMLELDKLDHSHLLEQREVKEYYSQLTFSVRKYLDRKVYDRALESTTSELIAYLELQRESGNLNIDRKTVDDLKRILQRADLAKFANSRPDVITAKEDRSNVKHIVDDVKTSIPEPTEEELMRDEMYRQAKLKQRRRKRIIIGVIVGAFALVIAVGALIATKGFTYVKDTYLGHPTKELLEGEWIRSEYGNPPVAITTPQVLKRGEIPLPPEAEQMLVGSETFLYGSLIGNFYTSVSTVQFNKQVQFNLDTAVDGIYTYLEGQGAQNIVMKREEFTTLNGAKGIRAFGTLEIENPVTGELIQNKYEILNFAENGGYQQINVIYEVDDVYAEEIAQRIIDSVELTNLNN
ncbi:LPXTG cell wall anchor domain-containing protein [Zunongwangia sp. F363]|uniref:LPXTG cell wall anchor domain-containing protein n=1 Tax=Autumnicola tepida TaxID=3075595 RepID=A0ABU3C6Q9_9FLAO|nr:LPXTG cell wall anchor domain-containing protein [Zunongwangia sp. F363]MDT0641999.1 LPXTG cell wall anchor domain-containing protein [Zunongwangia sp. F363]